jgi:hypothetical protein
MLVQVMNSRRKRSSFLLLLLNICITEVFPFYLGFRSQSSHLTFIHLAHPLHTQKRSKVVYALSLGNVATNNYYNTYDMQQWEKWQVGQGDSELMNKHSLKEWLNGTFYEQYWESQVPAITLSSETGKENQIATLQVDGHSFLGRMAIYKYLIQDWEDIFSDASLEQLWGSQVHEGHWLWSYAAQLDWQQRSLRLSETPREGNNEVQMTSDGRIATSSWWGYMNFCFSVAVLLGAINASNKGSNHCRVEIDEESQKLLNEDLACQKCVFIWEQLFSSVYPAYREKIRSALIDGRLHDDSLQSLRYQFQQEIWKTHTRIIETAVNSPKSKALLMLLPEPERKFGLGWARMVDILAASTFPTDLVTIVKDGTGFLPFHIVTDQVVADWKKIDSSTDRRSFSELCHQRAVETTHRLADLNDKMFDRVVKFWSRVVRDRKASRNMPRRVNRLVHGSWQDKIVELAKVLILFLRP